MNENKVFSDMDRLQKIKMTKTRQQWVILLNKSSYDWLVNIGSIFIEWYNQVVKHTSWVIIKNSNFAKTIRKLPKFIKI